MQGGACADKAVGCVMGAFVGNALGAALKNLHVSEINESKVTKVMNLMEKPLGLEIGQTEIEFGINLALINALKDQKELDLDTIIYQIGDWFKKGKNNDFSINLTSVLEPINL